MEAKISTTFLENLDNIVQYQNIRLISDICTYMKWSNTIKNKLIKELIKI